MIDRPLPDTILRAHEYVLRYNPRYLWKLLVHNRASTHEQWRDGVTPLHTAVIGNRAICVRLLLTCGADVNANDDYGMTPLHFATIYDVASCVRGLLVHGADVHAETWKGDTPLEFASTSRRSVVRKLLRAARVTPRIRHD